MSWGSRLVCRVNRTCILSLLVVCRCKVRADSANRASSPSAGANVAPTPGAPVRLVWRCVLPAWEGVPGMVSELGGLIVGPEAELAVLDEFLGGTSRAVAGEHPVAAAHLPEVAGNRHQVLGAGQDERIGGFA